jgi:hypothetical protein
MTALTPHRSNRAFCVPLLALLLAATAYAGPAFAQEQTEETTVEDVQAPVPPVDDVPLPEERPEDTDEADQQDAGDLQDGTIDPGTDPNGEADPAEAPAPEPKPENADTTTGEQEEATEEPDAEPGNEADREEAQDPEPEPEPLPEPEAEDSAALAACRVELRAMGTVFEERTAILPQGEEERGCGVAKPFNVSEIVPGVTLAPETEMRCETALALARFVRDEIQPAAEALPGLGPVTAIQHGSTYVCRGRNNNEEAEISEHAKGNAIDLMSFTFENGETIAVTPKDGDGDAAEAFQAAVRGGACLHFTTVLGPGADAYHDDHLHLDIATRNGGYRLCQ